MKDFFLESLDHKQGCTWYAGAHYTWQNVVNASSEPSLAR